MSDAPRTTDEYVARMEGRAASPLSRLTGADVTRMETREAAYAAQQDAYEQTKARVAGYVEQTQRQCWGVAADVVRRSGADPRSDEGKRETARIAAALRRAVMHAASPSDFRDAFSNAEHKRQEAYRHARSLSHD